MSESLIAAPSVWSQTAVSETEHGVGAACTRCGHDAQFDFGRVWLCLDCYHVVGSTCSGLSLPRPDDVC